MEKPHAICMPFPAQGHINAMLKVAKLLHFRGFHVTFVHTEYNSARIGSSNEMSPLLAADGFRFESIPDSLLPSINPTTKQDLPSLVLAVCNEFLSPFRDLMKRLNDPSGVPPVTCVSDCITGFTLEIAKEFGIPDLFLSSFSASGFMALFHLKELMEKGLVPIKSEDDLTNGYLDTPIDWMPGMKNMRIKDLPSFVRSTDPNDIFFNFSKDEIQSAFRADAIIINTFDDLEEPILDAMSSSLLPPIYCLGPLTQAMLAVDDNQLESINGNMWEEHTNCLAWLDQKSPGSVIYVNFGSITVMTSQHLVEFAWGLVKSGYEFLWIIRPDVVIGESSVLPKELLDETMKRGLVTSWCPQVDVLEHASIGGFLTHCGWNSTMEALSAGVPMICWPFFADQQTNCRYVCANWGVGTEIDVRVKREEVGERIREMMGGGKKGEEMRKMASKWKESASRTISPGGKSLENFEKVVKLLMKEKDG
uniref:Glycosyltransferase n=1 Tax=Crocus sativus TaxID=82528 RepID=A0A075M6P3_CROSA|nr:UDP-glucosyltransferase UGT85U1 [Crocus sativus]